MYRRGKPEARFWATAAGVNAPGGDALIFRRGRRRDNLATRCTTCNIYTDHYIVVSQVRDVKPLVILENTILESSVPER